MIRITGGKNRSRLLVTPETDLTKPTMDKVRQAVFSILTRDINNKEILDLFAGSGSYGFESLSRDAKFVTFVDKTRFAKSAIETNAKNLKEVNYQFVFMDAISYLKECDKKFDVIFADPPYKLEVYEELVDIVNKRSLLNDGGILVLESERELSINKDLFKEVRLYNYGLAKIYVLRK